MTSYFDSEPSSKVLMAFFKINMCCIDVVGAADPQDTIPNLDDMQKCMVGH